VLDAESVVVGTVMHSGGGGGGGGAQVQQLSAHESLESLKLAYDLPGKVNHRVHASAKRTHSCLAVLLRRTDARWAGWGGVRRTAQRPSMTAAQRRRWASERTTPPPPPVQLPAATGLQFRTARLRIVYIGF
jgi:hypothetical protein